MQPAKTESAAINRINNISFFILAAIISIFISISLIVDYLNNLYLLNSMKKLLLHVCCGPCATHTIKELMKEYDVTLFFYNPNIHPYGEYEKRFAEAEKVGKFFKLPIHQAGYALEWWMERIAGYEHEPEGGKRCTICFADRLTETARYAKENGFDCFTTTLSISPHKNSKTINELGEMLSKKHGVEWVHSDFKKKDGFKKSTELSKDLDLYRQKHCGCFYSVRHSVKNDVDKSD